MSACHSLAHPYPREDIQQLRVGDMVELSGVVYSARDAAHKRLTETLQSGGKLPFDITNQIIYYAGPAPAKPGQVIGSCGPTTAGRMDVFTPQLLHAGLAGMIGKGPRSLEVIEAIKETGAVYFAAVGGAAALSAKCIIESTVIAYEELGPEAVRKMTLERYPVIVAVDSKGGDIYTQGPNAYRNERGCNKSLSCSPF